MFRLGALGASLDLVGASELGSGGGGAFGLYLLINKTPETPATRFFGRNISIDRSVDGFIFFQFVKRRLNKSYFKTK